MGYELKPAEATMVRCASCEKEIPKEVALSSDDQDYVLYFCSSKCYEEWSDEQLAMKVQEAGEP
jgi:YHS domain-containing protein